MNQLERKEIRKIRKILIENGIDENRIKLLMPLIENAAFIKIKLDEAKENILDSSIVVEYDNGGGQKGLRENPSFKAYEALLRSYISSMNVILSSLPQEIVKKETEKVAETKTMLEIIRNKKKA